MFHLFKKVYLDFDTKISMSQDRIICSETHGGIDDLIDLSKAFYGLKINSVKSIGDLVGTEKPYNTFYDFFLSIDKFSTENNTSVYIYCDKISYYKLYFMWHKIILSSPDFSNMFNCLKAHMFRQVGILNRGRAERGVKSIGEMNDWLITEQESKDIWDSIILNQEEHTNLSNFTKQNAQHLGIEYLLASYLYDGRYSAELTKTMSVLVRKDIEKLLYELKEMILGNPFHPLILKILKVENGPYDFSNFVNIINDNSSLVQLLFRKDIWGENNISLLQPSSKGTIDFSSISDEEVAQLKAITHKFYGVLYLSPEKASEDELIIEKYFEVDKIDFIKLLRKDVWSNEDMREILEYEISHQYDFAGSFSSLYVQSVNDYLIVHLIRNSENKEVLKPFVLN
jgi:hypothetical protein